MKKKLKYLLIFVLFFTVGISSVSAYPTFTSKGSEGLPPGVTYNWYTETNGHDLCANDGVCKHMYGNWNFYDVQISSTEWHILYCLNLNKDWIQDGHMNSYGSLESIVFTDTSLSQSEKTKRINLLKRLLIFGANVNPTNNKSIEDIMASDTSTRNYQVQLIAMQVLVWEIMEGGRTNFDSVTPTWHGEYSFYEQVVKPNGGSNPSKTGTIYYYYKKFIEDTKNGENVGNPSAFNKNYTLTYDNSNKRYQKVVTGLGEYLDCESNDSDVKTSVTRGARKVLVYTTKEIKASSPVTITCKFAKGTGTPSSNDTELFRYYRFAENPNDNQDMVYGNGYKVFKATFTVNTESIPFAIKKVNTNNESLPDVKFKLGHVQNTAYRGIEIEANSNKNYALKYSGDYTVSEMAETVPKGYERIPDFNITIDANTHKITKCDSSKTDNSGNIVSCLGDQVAVRYSGSTIELHIVNAAKNFQIMKVDQKGNAIKGASFEIKDSKNNLVKFRLASGNIYTYDTAGTVTTLYNASSHSYPIALLPADEYTIVEKSVPYPYRLPSNEADCSTKIKIDSNRNLLVYDKSQKKYVNLGEAPVKITNYTTKFTIHKVGHGNPLEGVQFELYNSDKTVQIKANMTSAGVYDYIDDQNSATASVYVTNSAGDITVNNIPEGTYWIKEVNTIPPYVLPTGDGVYTKLEVKIGASGVAINNSYTNNTIEISNTPNSFNFYKRDTEGNALTTGKYKLQKYNKETDKYEDLKLVEVKNDGTYNPNTVIYKVDEENGKIQFTLTKGVATFIDMESSSTYRIIETVAPEGYTKASTKDTATVHIDEYGNASGLLVLIDQKIVKEDDSAFAELIINIQTGKQRIMYAAVIVLVISIIVGLIVYNKRK